MITQETADVINEALKKWTQEKDKLVVAIDGYTGVGKTTLLKRLAELNHDLLPVNRDNFLLDRKVVETLLKNTDDKSKVFELKVCDIHAIKELVTAFRRSEKCYKVNVYNEKSGERDIPKTFDLEKKILIIEGVFMFHPRGLNRLWDKRIYLDGNIEDIDKRRIKREKARWGKEYFPETHPDSYFRQVIIALKRYQDLYEPKKMADLVIHV